MFVIGSGNVQLVDQGDGATLMKYEGELQIGGKLAGVGQRLMDSVSKSIIRQGLESMDKALQARMAPEPEVVVEPEPKPAPARAYQPPSEAQFAATVAKDVVEDLVADIFSPESQSAWVAAAIAIIGVVIGFWLGRIRAGRR